MKLLILNGPNINMLGRRETDIYGNQTYDDLVKMIKDYVSLNNIEVKIFQSNHEGDLIDEIQNAYNKFDGIIINAGGFTHTSIAIMDAIKAINIKTVEVHISDINNREDFRKISYISKVAEKVIVGHGLKGYIEAIDYFIK